MQYLLNTIELI